MASDNLQRILAPFTQADNSITRKYGGTGLGLSIVTRLLGLMGSTLEVSSSPEQGSTFAFSVELGVALKPAQSVFQLPEELAQVRVLIVDDSRDACLMLESMLTEFSLAATACKSGQAALEELERAAHTPNENPYRLVLLDWRMPDMDGLETARRIRNRLGPGLEIIIISGYTTTDIQKECSDLGISVYLNKPFNLTVLFNGIMKAFGKESRNHTQHGGSHSRGSSYPIQLRDARVLLVEDDKVNQIVAQELLKRFGAEVITVGNGLSGAEAALGAHGFDMVFMDIQMPEMNGYEAAAAIRRVKGELELPIIAMTAHAFSEERDRCLAAGMNDHIAKPIDPDLLYSVLLKWLSPEKVKNALSVQKMVDESVVPRSFPETLPGIEVSVLLQRCGGNESLAREIIISFREQHRNACSELCNAIEHGNFEQVRALVHTLKGLAGTIGAHSLAATMTQLEKELKGGAPVMIPTLMKQQLDEVFAAAAVLAEATATQTLDTSGEQLPKEELEPLLIELYDLLHNNSLGAKKLFERVKHQFTPSDQDEIHSQMARLDFEMALSAVERAAQSCGIHLGRTL